MVVASPVLAAIYTRLGSKGKDLTMPMKFTLGMFLCALGFLTAAAAGMWFADAQGLTSPWFIVLVYLFQSLGELLISALGLAMVAALVPQHLMGFILGMWFLTRAAAFLLGGYVATFTAVPENITDPLQTLPIYTGVFSKIGLVTLAVTVVMAIMVPWLNRMINTPYRTVILVPDAAYALSGLQIIENRRPDKRNAIGQSVTPSEGFRHKYQTDALW